MTYTWDFRKNSELSRGCYGGVENKLLTIVKALTQRIHSWKKIYTFFIIPDSTEAKDNIRRSFCHFANFFEDSKTAAERKAQHPKAFILSIDEAFAFTQKVVSTSRSINRQQRQISLFRALLSDMCLCTLGHYV